VFDEALVHSGRAVALAGELIRIDTTNTGDPDR
jgi:hypothetical protein